MNRTALEARLERLNDALAGWNAVAVGEIREPATDGELAACEDALGVPLPSTYRRLLTYWNGLTVRIYHGGERHPEGWTNLFRVAGTADVARFTRELRESIGARTAGIETTEDTAAEAVGKSMVAADLQYDVAIVMSWAGYRGDMSFPVYMFERTPSPDDVRHVRGPGIQIATSLEEHIDRSFAQMITASGNPVYW